MSRCARPEGGRDSRVRIIKRDLQFTGLCQGWCLQTYLMLWTCTIASSGNTVSDNALSVLPFEDHFLMFKRREIRLERLCLVIGPLTGVLTQAIGRMQKDLHPNWRYGNRSMPLDPYISAVAVRPDTSPCLQAVEREWVLGPHQKTTSRNRTTLLTSYISILALFSTGHRTFRRMVSRDDGFKRRLTLALLSSVLQSSYLS